ncbi:hypothetical protein [Actinotalea sp. JY-7876]|uniref:hypothetical protein n=1 Tax=Actinotalea sp. JY-7876 TaxID=2758442 RepID=UPI0015F5D9D9|nr:hypothetical protein [Actinotalea sp. JY-7876]
MKRIFFRPSGAAIGLYASGLLVSGAPLFAYVLLAGAWVAALLREPVRLAFGVWSYDQVLRRSVLTKKERRKALATHLASLDREPP